MPPVGQQIVIQKEHQLVVDAAKFLFHRGDRRGS